VKIVHSRVIKSSSNAWKWTTGCLTSWMYYNPQTLAPYFRQRNWFYMVSQNRVNIPPIARKNVTQRGGGLKAGCGCLFVSVLDVAVLFIISYPSREFYYNEYICYTKLIAYLYDVPYAWLHFLMKHVLWNEQQLVS
jgi:hypothetical protein